MLRTDVRSLVSQFRPAAGYTHRRTEFLPSTTNFINKFYIDFHRINNEFLMSMCHHVIRRLSHDIHRIKENKELEKRILLFMAMAESCAHTFVIFVRWAEHIKIPSTIFSSRILYSQSSSDNFAKFMPRRLIISHERSVNEYRNLNFLDAPSSVTIDIQKGRVYLQRIIIAGLASFWDKRRIRAADSHDEGAIRKNWISPSAIT